MTREEAIETLKLLKPNMRFDNSGWLCIKQALDMAIKALSQEPKSGKWNTYEIYQGGIKETWYECSECKWSSALLIPRKYCPNCGTDMKG